MSLCVDNWILCDVLICYFLFFVHIYLVTSLFLPPSPTLTFTITHSHTERLVGGEAGVSMSYQVRSQHEVKHDIRKTVCARRLCHPHQGVGETDRHTEMYINSKVRRQGGQVK